MSLLPLFIAGLFLTGAATASLATSWPVERRGWMLMFSALGLTLAAVH